jgi:hypothetical protein
MHTPISRNDYHPAISYSPDDAPITRAERKAQLLRGPSWYALFASSMPLATVGQRTVSVVCNAIVDRYLKWRLERGLLTLRNGVLVPTTPDERARMQRGK